MKFYFEDTSLSYSEISDIMTRLFGPSSEDTWFNSADHHFLAERLHKAYIEVKINESSPELTILWLLWR